MFGKLSIAVVTLGLLLAANGTQAQDVQELPGATRVVRTQEVAVDGLTRQDAISVAFTVPSKAATTLLLHNFAFNGEPITTDKIHLRQIAPGVVEITSIAWEVGYWRFQVRDAASYYGLGERFDTLDHAHTIVKNLSMDNAGVKGTSTYKPIPFFMSTTGYGLWLDTTGEATFDMNASDREEMIVDATTAKLRIVLFTGPEFPGILEKFTAQAGRAILPPYWAFAPWMARDYHQNQDQVKEDVDKTRELGLPASVILIDSPWTSAYNDYKFNPKQFADAPAMVKHLHEEELQAGPLAHLVDQLEERHAEGGRIRRQDVAALGELSVCRGSRPVCKEPERQPLGRPLVERSGFDDRLHLSQGEGVVAGPSPPSHQGWRGRIQRR